jgi:hypothetical protein
VSSMEVMPRRWPCFTSATSPLSAPQRQLPFSRRPLTLHLSALPTSSPGHFAAGDSPDLRRSISLVLRCRNGRDVEYMRAVRR